MKGVKNKTFVQFFQYWLKIPIQTVCSFIKQFLLLSFKFSLKSEQVKKNARTVQSLALNNIILVSIL